MPNLIRNKLFTEVALERLAQKQSYLTFEKSFYRIIKNEDLAVFKETGNA